jgi:hypothetical protein
MKLVSVRVECRLLIGWFNGAFRNLAVIDQLIHGIYASEK